MKTPSSFLRSGASLLVLLSFACSASAMMPVPVGPAGDERAVGPVRRVATEAEVDRFVEEWLCSIKAEHDEVLLIVSPVYKKLREEGKTARMAFYLDYKKLAADLIGRPQEQFSRTWETKRIDVYTFFDALLKGVNLARCSAVDTDPLDGYFLQNFYNPLFKQLEIMGAVKAEEIFNLVPAGAREFLGFFRHEGNYHACAVDARNPCYLYVPCSYGWTYNKSVDEIIKPAVLVNDEAVVSAAGYLVSFSQQTPQALNIRTYYGTKNPNPDLCFRENAHLREVSGNREPYCSLKRMLEEQRRKQDDPEDPRVFIPTDIAPEDAPYVSYLLLKDLEGEVDSQAPEIQEFLQYAYAKAMAGLLTDEAGAGPAEAALPLPSLAELRAQLECQLIEEEQQAISRQVVAGQVHGRSKSSQPKKLSAKQKSRRTATKKAGGPAEPVVDKMQELRIKASTTFAERLNGARIKYKDLLHLLTRARGEVLRGHPQSIQSDVSFSTKGSHRTVHDTLGAVTVARPHGGKDSLPRRVAQGILSRMRNGLIASLMGAEDQ